MCTCVLDFETLDPYISAGYGSGWPFAVREYRTPEFKILGASIKGLEGDLFKEAVYITDLEALRGYIAQFDTFVMHNAQYDIGCMLVLFQVKPDDIREFLKNKTFYDTMLMAKLLNQHCFQYNLEILSKKNGQAIKKKSVLTDYVWQSGLFQTCYQEEHITQKHTRPSEDVLSRFSMKCLDRIPIEIVGDYCNADVEATHVLFRTYRDNLARFPAEFNWLTYSTLLKACVDMRARGVRIDLTRAITTKELLESKIEVLLKELYQICGKEFNLNSPKQVLEVMQNLGLSGFLKTPKGGLSVGKSWLTSQEHIVCKLIIKIKNYSKLSRDFLDKLISYQQIHKDNNVDDCRIFPQLNIFGATATGRFSSSRSGKGSKSYELNIQQIPIRGEDVEANSYLRGCFIADEGTQWISADYSNQEQRLQIHFASYLGFTSAQSLVKLLNENPHADIHQVIADFCQIERTPAKTINLGLSYGMGGKKLCRALGLPTKWVYSLRQGKEIEVPGEEGEALLAQYHSFLPFMKQLQQYCKNTLREFKYIKTLAGRKLFIDPPMKIEGEWVSFERKGLSKEVQGSGADVTIEGIVNCYNAGLMLLFTVHDEIDIISRDVDKDKTILAYCMDEAVCKTFKLAVPMTIDVSVGPSWAGE